MNYIRHLNGFFVRLAEDQRMTPYHISLYFALFQQWNEERFVEQIIISRGEMMQLSRIGSANTYARCMKELAEWGYISYSASSNLHSGSKVSCIPFDTATDAETDTTKNTTGDTGIETDIPDDTGEDIGRNACNPTNIGSDTERSIATDTDIKIDTTSNTGADTTASTGISGGLKNDTADNIARNTGITANTENDTGRSPSDPKNNSAGIISDIPSDTASDTLFINNTNKNKQEEKREKINQEENFEEKWKRQNRTPKVNSEDSSKRQNQIPDLRSVEQFFEQNQFLRSEAQQFHLHYQSAGWKTGGGIKIQDWQAVARKWMINAQSLKKDERESNQIGTSKLSVTVNKDYSEPL